MGIFNSILHSVGIRSTEDYRTNEAYDRGEITSETRDDSLRDNMRDEDRRSRNNPYPSPGDDVYRAVRKVIR